jgi:two-component sensor histidine kinase
LSLYTLQEKEVLLKEIHHRVKNNLQIVSALLDLQSSHTEDKQALEMFKESRGRVKSLAQIHERLCRSQDLAHVDFAEYVRQLADDLYHAYKVSNDEIVLDVDVNVRQISIDIAIPCGLLINELMSNALKYAFVDARKGRLRVALRRISDNTNVLTVADTGAGFPPGLDFRNTTSFGLQLVNTLVEQLKGKIELKTDRGAEFTVTFPDKR